MQAAKYVCTAHALAMGSANIVWVRLSALTILELSAGNSLYQKNLTSSVSSPSA